MKNISIAISGVNIIVKVGAAHKSLFDPSVVTESRKEVNNEL